jgi:hypothetical protein
VAERRKNALDIPTLLAIGMVAYLVKNVVHEGVGHGGVCLLAGGKAIGISSAWWDGSYDGVSAWAIRGVKAGGTLANLSLGLALVPALRRLSDGRRPRLQFFVWLLIVVNLFSGAGYLLADPIGHFGDWSAFLEGLEPSTPLRLGLIVLGAGISALTLRFALRTMEPFLTAQTAERRRRARWLCWGPYLLGGTVFTLAGLLNPYGREFAVSSALATFGGTAFLAWLPAWVKTPSMTTSNATMVLDRSPTWIGAGTASAIVTIAVLGRGVFF